MVGSGVGQGGEGVTDGVGDGVGLGFGVGVAVGVGVTEGVTEGVTLGFTVGLGGPTGLITGFNERNATATMAMSARMIKICPARRRRWCRLWCLWCSSVIIVVRIKRERIIPLGPTNGGGGVWGPRARARSYFLRVGTCDAGGDGGGDGGVRRSCRLSRVGCLEREYPYCRF